VADDPPYSALVDLFGMSRVGVVKALSGKYRPGTVMAGMVRRDESVYVKSHRSGFSIQGADSSASPGEWREGESALPFPPIARTHSHGRAKPNSKIAVEAISHPGAAS
jgi:hypothetical protein